MFIGFTEPEQNWTKMPNRIATMEFSSLAEMRVVIYVLRHTWGYQEFGGHKRITLDEFEHGRKRQDQSRIDSGTSMGRSSIRRGIESAVAHGYLERIADGRDAARQSFYYALRMRGSESNPLRERSAPPVGAKRTPDQRKKLEKETSVPAPQKSQGTESYFSVTPEPEYVDVEEEETRTRPKWQVPGNKFQREFLAVCGAKWFKSKQKTAVKKLAGCLAVGATLTDTACFHRCLDELRNCENFPDRKIAMPISWLHWRSEHARSNRWSVQGFINSLFDRDALVRHCQVMLKKIGGSAAEESPEEYAARTGKVIYT